MRIVGVLGVALAGLFVIGAVTAYGQINTRSQYGGTTAAVVDDKENLRVPSDYRTAYQMLGSWAVAKDDGRFGATVGVSPGSTQLIPRRPHPGSTRAAIRSRTDKRGVALMICHWSSRRPAPMEERCSTFAFGSYTWPLA